MSEIITSANIDLVIEQNRTIADEILSEAASFRAAHMTRNMVSPSQQAMLTLQASGLLQIPVEDAYLSGAIFVKDDRTIPFINTAMPRANQYFTAWHEIYHLMFDRVSFDYFIGAENTLEERKAEYFAACMLLDGVGDYFSGLTKMDFLTKVFTTMLIYQAPYKAVLVSLYEYAVQHRQWGIKKQIREALDLQIDDMPERFRRMGLDDSLVLPSYVVNTSYLMGLITNCEEKYPEQTYHEDNAEFLKNIIKEIQVIV